MRGRRGEEEVEVCGEVEKHCSPKDEERSLKAGTELRFKILFLGA